MVARRKHVVPQLKGRRWGKAADTSCSSRCSNSGLELSASPIWGLFLVDFPLAGEGRSKIRALRHTHGTLLSTTSGVCSDFSFKLNPILFT